MQIHSAQTYNADVSPTNVLDDRSLATIFVEARTANAFLDRAIPHPLLDQALELTLLGPTSGNSLPLRIVFVESRDAKDKLKPALTERNRDKTMSAPVTAIVAADVKFFEQYPRLFPDRAETFMNMYRAMPDSAQRSAAWDNALLQMGYLIIALRSVGLDAGPMAGFERSVVDEAFFPDGRFVSQYLINIGFADKANVFPRLPRFRPSEIAQYA